MSLQLPSERPEFADLAAFYESNIGPWLSKKEALRREAIRNAFIAGGAFAALGLFLLLVTPGDSKITILIITIGMATAIGGWFISKARAQITEGLIGRIASHLGFSYRHEIARPDYFEKFQRLKFFENFNREHWEDEVKGAHDGHQFILCECHLRYKTSGKNNSTRTIFHGQLLMLDYPKEFLGVTVLRRDRGIMNRFGKPGREFHQVGLASPKFEKAYESMVNGPS